MKLKSNQPKAFAEQLVKIPIDWYGYWGQVTITVVMGQQPGCLYLNLENLHLEYLHAKLHAYV